MRLTGIQAAGSIPVRDAEIFFLVFEFDERPLPPTQAHDENSLKFVHYQLNVNLLYTSIKLIIEE